MQYSVTRETNTTSTGKVYADMGSSGSWRPKGRTSVLFPAFLNAVPDGRFTPGPFVSTVIPVLHSFGTLGLGSIWDEDKELRAGSQLL